MKASWIAAGAAILVLFPAFFSALAQEREGFDMRENERFMPPEEGDRRIERNEIRSERRIIMQTLGDPMRQMEGNLRLREMEMRELEENDPEKYELVSKIEKMETASEEASEKYRRAESEEEKTELETDLLGILDQLFDLKIELEQLEQSRLEEEARELKERIENRKKAREQIIKLRLDDLLGKREHLEW